MNKHNVPKPEHKKSNAGHTALAEGAKALLFVTEHVVDEKVAEARERLTKLLEDLREEVVETAESVDEAVKARPYKTMGICTGLGLIIGILLTRRFYQKD